METQLLQPLLVFGFLLVGTMLGLRSPLKNCKTKRFVAGSKITVIDATTDPPTQTPVLVTEGEVSGFVLENVESGANGVLVYETDGQGYVTPKATGVIGAGVRVFWDPNGNPIGGVAGTGAAVSADDATHIFLGFNAGVATLSAGPNVTVVLQSASLVADAKTV